MSQVNTVTGALDNQQLGRTLMHEHILIGYPGWYLDKRQPTYNRNEAMARVIDAFNQIKDFGVETVVDPCPSDMGRDPIFYAELSVKTGVNVICATGVYYESIGGNFTFRHLEQEAITEIYIREIEDGISDTGVKPGLIKIATGRGKVTDYERKVISAAADAAKYTGVPILTHTEKCTCGHDQIDIVTNAGVAASRMLIGHSDGTADLNHQILLAERGVYVGFDRFGLETEISDDIRMTNLCAMIDAGYLDQLVMSHDYTSCWKGGIPGQAPGTYLEKILPNWRMTHIFENILPALKSRGMKDEDFDVIFRQNPSRFFDHDVSCNHE